MQCVTGGWSCLPPQMIITNFIHDKVHGRENQSLSNGREDLKHLTISRPLSPPPEQLLQLCFTNTLL